MWRSERAGERLCEYSVFAPVSPELHEFEPRFPLDRPVRKSDGFRNAAGGGGVAGDTSRFEFAHEIERQRKFALDHGGGRGARSDTGQEAGADLPDLRRICLGWNVGERFVDNPTAEGFGLGELPG